MFRFKALLLIFGILVVSFFFPPFIFLLVIALLFHDWFYTRDSKPDALALTAFLDTKRGYLQSSQWKSKRSQVLHHYNFICQSCGSPATEVHHLSGYSQIPNEPLSSLTALCRDCHQLQHNIYGYPQTLEEYYSWDVPLYKKEN